MQKRTLWILVCCMLFALSGCGLFQEKNSNESDTSEPEENAQYKIETETETELGIELEIGTEVETENSSETEMIEKPEIVLETQDEETALDNPQSNSQTGVSKNEGQTATGSQQNTPAQPSENQSETPESESQEPEPETPAQPARGEYLVTGKDISTANFSVGDAMYDFTITTIDGETMMLSDLLKEKDMVMLNFWYINCTCCDAEFPYMAQAYESRRNDVEIIALNPYDSQMNIEYYRGNATMPFKVAQCDYSWVSAFNITGFPTSIVIDRYGTIKEIHVGAILTADGFTSIFDRYID